MPKLRNRPYWDTYGNRHVAELVDKLQRGDQSVVLESTAENAELDSVPVLEVDTGVAPVSAENTAKLLFVSNYPLKIPEKHQEYALLGRLEVIPCRNPVPRERQIPDLHKILHREAGYIVGLAMEALVEFEARNGAFTPLPPEFEGEAVQATDVEQDIVDFVHDCCLLDEGAICTTAELFEAFKQYTYECSINDTQFSKMLAQLFRQLKRYRTSSIRGYRGIKLKPARE